MAITATNKPLNRFNNITVCEYYTIILASVNHFVVIFNAACNCIISNSDDDNHIVLQPITKRSDCQRNYINASYINVIPCVVYYVKLTTLCRDMINNMNLLLVKV